GQPAPLLDPSDLQRAGRPRVQQRDELLVDLVDSAPQALERRAGRRVRRRCGSRPGLARRLRLGLVPLVDAHACPFSQRTNAPARVAASPSAAASAITCTRALPTTAASAYAATSCTCSGRERPKPSAMGNELIARIRSARGLADPATTDRAPVTPSLEIAY